MGRLVYREMNNLQTVYKKAKKKKLTYMYLKDKEDDE